MLIRRGRDHTTEVSVGCTSSCGSWSLLMFQMHPAGGWWLGTTTWAVQSHCKSLLGEQTYSTWPGSVLSLYVNFLRRNQMTGFFFFFFCGQISKDSEVEQFHTKEFHEVDS